MSDAGQSTGTSTSLGAIPVPLPLLAAPRFVTWPVTSRAWSFWTSGLGQPQTRAGRVCLRTGMRSSALERVCGSSWARVLLGPVGSGCKTLIIPLRGAEDREEEIQGKVWESAALTSDKPPFSVACQRWCWARGHGCRTMLVWTNITNITPGCGTCRVCPSNSQHTHAGHTSFSCTHLSFCLWALLSPRLRAGGGSGEPQPQSLLPWLVPVCFHRSCCSHSMILHVEPASDQTFNLEGKAKENSGELNYLLLHTIIWHNTAQQ